MAIVRGTLGWVFVGLWCLFDYSNGDLVYQLQGQNSSDNTTCIVLQPSDTMIPSVVDVQAASDVNSQTNISYLEEFTICAAYSISSFTDKPSIYSYAINDTHTNVLALAVTPEKFYVTYDYSAIEVFSDDLYSLGVWKHVCIVGIKGENHTFYMNGEVIKSWSWGTAPPLPTGGAFVLGQDQDMLMGGYSEGQAFHGRISQVNAWSRALTKSDIERVVACNTNSQEHGDWINWEKSPWKPQGEVTLMSDGPCSEQRHRIYLFNMKRPREDAFRMLLLLGLEPYLPRNASEAMEVKKLLSEMGEMCDNAAVTGKSVWINADFNATNESWEQVDTGEQIEFPMKRKKRTYESKEGAVQVTDDTWMTDDVDNENCFAGIADGDAKLFYLRGFDDKYDKTCPFCYSFIINQGSTNETFYLEGLHKKSIRFENGTWNLLQDYQNKILATHGESKNLPVGRKIWNIFTNSNKTIQKIFTLSSCSELEFTCGDGSCVKMSERCDMVTDCSDWSDENFCAPVKVPDGYINSLPPSSNLSLEFTVQLEVLNIDLQKMAFHLELEVSLKWYDKHISFHNLREGYGTNLICITGECNLWRPRIEVAPTLGLYEKRPSPVVINREAEGRIIVDDKVYKGSQNSLQQVFKMQPMIRCNFNLRDFPFDVQTCSFNVTIENINNNEMVFPGNEHNLKIHRLELDTYSIVNHSMRPIEGTPRMSIMLRISRKFEEHLWGTYLPTFLLLAIGYSTLFLPAEPFNDRGTMSLTTLLVLVSLYTDYLVAIPGTAYNTQSDKWFIFAMVFLTLIIVTHLYTSGTNDHDCKQTPIAWSKIAEAKVAAATILCPQELASKGRTSFNVCRMQLYYSRIIFGLLFAAFIIVYPVVIAIYRSMELSAEGI